MRNPDFLGSILHLRSCKHCSCPTSRRGLTCLICYLFYINAALTHSNKHDTHTLSPINTQVLPAHSTQEGSRPYHMFRLPRHRPARRDCSTDPNSTPQKTRPRASFSCAECQSTVGALQRSGGSRTMPPTASTARPSSPPLQIPAHSWHLDPCPTRKRWQNMHTAPAKAAGAGGLQTLASNGKLSQHHGTHNVLR